MMAWEDVLALPRDPVAALIAAARRSFCKHFHRDITRPVNGEYICLECGRVWPCAWR